MKKVFSLILCLALVLALAVPSFAEGSKDYGFDETTEETEAKQVRDDAQVAYDEAAGEADKAKEEAETKVVEANIASQEAEAANKATGEASQKADEAAQALEDAEAKQKEAETALEEAQKNYDELIEKNPNAEEDLEEAQKAADDAAKAAEEAQKSYDAAKEKADAAQKTADEKNQALEEAKKAAEAAKKTAEEKDAAAKEAAKALEDAQKAYDDALAEQADSKEQKEAEKAQADAEAKLKADKATQSQKDQEKKDAESDKQAADKELSDYQAEMNKLKNSRDFFDWLSKNGKTDDIKNDAALAVRVLDNKMTADDEAIVLNDGSFIVGTITPFSTVYPSTVLGEDTDATNLDNMKKALKWFNTGNTDYRSKDSAIAQLPVSPTLMAMGQINANYIADDNWGHTRTFNALENIAQSGSGSENTSFNPYVGWHDEEKEVYDYMKANGVSEAEAIEAVNNGAHTTGHYKTLMEKDGYPTEVIGGYGYAVGSWGSMVSTVHTHQFGWNTKPGSGVSVTDMNNYIAAYEKSLTDKEDELKDNVADAEKKVATATTALEEADKKVKASEDDVAAKKQAVQDIKDKLAEAVKTTKEALDKATTADENAKKEADAAAKDQAAKEDAKAKAQQEADDANAANETAQNELKTAADNKNIADKDKAAAEEELKKQQEINDAIEKAAEELETAKDNKAEADKAVEDAQKASGAAKEASEEATKTANEKTAADEAAAEAAKAAKDAYNAAKLKAEAAKAALEEAQAAYDAIIVKDMKVENSKKEYMVGDKFDPSTIKVTITHEDGTEEVLEADAFDVAKPMIPAALTPEKILETKKTPMKVPFAVHFNGKAVEQAIEVKPFDYEIIENANGSWTKESGSDYAITSNAPFDKHAAVYVNGQKVDPGNYTAEAGSTKITFKNSYMEGLNVGTVPVQIFATDGVAETNMTIVPAPKAEETKPTQSETKPSSGTTTTPTGTTTTSTSTTTSTTSSAAANTGDDSNMMLWAVLLIAAASMSVLIKVRRAR